jgi:hypothetical protein
MVAITNNKFWGIGYNAAVPQHANKKCAQHGGVDTDYCDNDLYF